MRHLGLLMLVPLVTLAPRAEACDAAKGKDVFAMCVACHALEASTGGREGPSLAGLMGRKAGAVPNYRYSPALVASGWSWNRETLDRYLTNPRRALPGTTMTFIGLKDPAEREAVICYLETVTGGAPVAAAAVQTLRDSAPRR